jgi:hypothetical protein
LFIHAKFASIIIPPREVPVRDEKRVIAPTSAVRKEEFRVGGAAWPRRFAGFLSFCALCDRIAGVDTLPRRPPVVCPMASDLS